MSLNARWTEHREKNPRARARDVAHALDVSEAELVDAGCGVTATRLRPDWGPLLEGLGSLGEVMALTRNEAAVHERVGPWTGLRFQGPHGIVYGGPVDLRLFPRCWAWAFAVEVEGPKGTKRSVQIFDRHGEAVHKVHLRPSSDQDAWQPFVDAHADADPSPVAPAPAPPAQESAAAPDVTALLDGWAGLQDTHDFFGLLRKHGVTRRAALRLAEGRYTRQVGAEATGSVLRQVAASGMPIMVFVGNRGCLQIYTGPVKTIKPFKGWLNILDPGFNLHLLESMIHRSWVVFKPTRFGGVTSLELMDADGGVILQLFSKRSGEDAPESEAWRALLNGL